VRWEILKIETARDFAKRREPGTGDCAAILKIYVFTRLRSHKHLINALSLFKKFDVDCNSGERYFSVFNFVERHNIRKGQSRVANWETRGLRTRVYWD
jgi:hypothetical protein